MKIREMKQIWTVNVLKIKFRIKLRRRAPTLEARMAKQVTQCLSLQGSAHETIENRAKYILARFLTQVDMNMGMI